MEGATKTPVPGGKGSAARARDSRPVEFGRKLVWAAFQYFTNPNSSSRTRQTRKTSSHLTPLFGFPANHGLGQGHLL